MEVIQGIIDSLTNGDFSIDTITNFFAGLAENETIAQIISTITGLFG